MQKHFVNLSIITVAFMLIGFLVDTYVLAQTSLKFVYWLAPLFCFVTMGIHKWLLKSLNNREKRFPQLYMLSIIMKMILFFVCTIVYLLLYREKAVEFILVLLVLYLTYSAIETARVSKITKGTKND